MWDWVLLRGKERVCLCVRDDDDDDDDVLSICVCVCTCLYETVGSKVIVSSGVVERPFVADVVKVKKTKMARNKKSTTLVDVRWYYYPEDTKWGRRSFHGRAEVFESNHKDEIHLESIIDVCQVVGVDEYAVRICKTSRAAHCVRNDVSPSRDTSVRVVGTRVRIHTCEREYDMVGVVVVRV